MLKSVYFNLFALLICSALLVFNVLTREWYLFALDIVVWLAWLHLTMCGYSAYRFRQDSVIFDPENILSESEQEAVLKAPELAEAAETVASIRQVLFGLRFGGFSALSIEYDASARMYRIRMLRDGSILRFFRKKMMEDAVFDSLEEAGISIWNVAVMVY
ncbi:hypothetical protein ACOJUR_12245 [Alicyclobacillus tolerans]|uniref:hypothetical protein n=1 Tax=Alicyclobacillus tolerans TaxID=90970 RepID=UPI003B7AC959